MTTSITAPLQSKNLHQHYTSSRASVGLITTKGKKINFVGHEFYTQDPEIIDYLDTEIGLGLGVITKGKPVTSASRDPIANLRAQIIEEHEAKKAKEASDEALGITKDMGTTKPKDAHKLGAVTSKGVAS